MMSKPFRTKICGITNQQDATDAAEAGADAIGLNFYATSLRSVTADEASRIQTPEEVARVGVFVNHEMDEIKRIANSAKLDFVQLHGDETPVEAAKLGGVPLIPVFRIRSGAEAQEVLGQIEKWTSKDELNIAAILLDAQVGKAYGGTGHQLDWGLAKVIVEECQVPLILAGGLNAENVGQSIDEVGPCGVDVASGVEALPGKKDLRLVREFVANATIAFEK